MVFLKAILAIYTAFFLFFSCNLQAEMSNLKSLIFKEKLKYCLIDKSECKNNDELYSHAANFIFNNEETKDSWLLIEKLADEGHLDSIFLNIERYYRKLDQETNNRSIELTKEKLKNYSLKAIKAVSQIGKEDRNPSIMMNMSFIYETGISEIKDEKLAFLLALEASEQGDKYALSQVIRMYRDGIGTEKNMKMANALYEKLVQTK